MEYALFKGYVKLDVRDRYSKHKLYSIKQVRKIPRNRLSFEPVNINTLLVCGEQHIAARL